MIDICHLSHSIGKTSVLKDVCLTVPDGTVMGLVGVNGVSFGAWRSLA